MTPLAPDLFDTDYQRLTELGRSLIPRNAPEWTDHNVHDPGIMLIELLAWTAEAQIYSLARMRGDERRAYAALLGIGESRPDPADALLWRASDAPLPADGLVLEGGSVVTVQRADPVRFTLSHTVAPTAARLDAVETVARDGSMVTGHDFAQSRPGASFRPFGDDPAAGAVFVLRFSGILVAADAVDRAAVLALGVRTAGPQVGAPEGPVRIAAELVVGMQRHTLPIVLDQTAGLTRTGAILLGLGNVPAPPVVDAAIELRALPGRLPFAPCIEAIRVNVLPVIQVETGNVVHPPLEPMPDLELAIAAGDGQPIGPPTVMVGTDRWNVVDTLARCGPDDPVFLFDDARGRVRFGNGVNGRIPQGANIHIFHQATRGADGNLAAGLGWTVPGYPAGTWLNLDAATGGAAAANLQELRREARARVRERHLIVTADDLEQAALALTDLKVVRAAALPSASGRKLIVLRARDGGADDGAVPEDPRWRRHVAGRLRPRLMLGEPLRVRAPDYVPFGVDAELLAEPGQDPDAIGERAFDILARALSPVTVEPGIPPWPLGRRVELADLRARLRMVPGVARVIDCGFTSPGPSDFGKASLPVLVRARSHLRVNRPGRG